MDAGFGTDEGNVEMKALSDGRILVDEGGVE